MDIETSDINTLLQDPEVLTFLECYVKKQQQGLAGDYGKTPQFWLKYVSLVDTLHALHLAIQSNNFEEKIQCWRKMLPLFFFF